LTLISATRGSRNFDGWPSAFISGEPYRSNFENLAQATPASFVLVDVFSKLTTHHPVNPVYPCSFGRRRIGDTTQTEDQAVCDVPLGEARAARSRAISPIRRSDGIKIDEQDKPHFEGQRDQAFSASTFNVKRAEQLLASAGAESGSSKFPKKTKIPNTRSAPAKPSQTPAKPEVETQRH
jgi:hypothetical protein